MKLPYFFFHWPEFWNMPQKVVSVTGRLLKRPFNLFSSFFQRFILREHLSGNNKIPLFNYNNFSFHFDFINK